MTEMRQSEAESRIQEESILVLLFESMDWDLRTLCAAASASRRLNAVAKRVLWRRMCAHRAPRMAAALSAGFSGGWDAVGKLLVFCCGWEGSTPNFRVARRSPGHVAGETRFSKTSGRSFLARECREDVAYVSDPCEHGVGAAEGDLGVYRGVITGFRRSRTRACLVRRRAELDGRVRCPYCGARVWSMTAARLVPRAAARRLGCRDGALEYFVCVNGHLHGTCWLLPLSSDGEDEEGGGDGDGGGGGGGGGGGDSRMVAK